MEGLESEGGGTKKGWLLGYKVKAMSRESPSQKAAHVLDPDLRTHWSTSTNTKEWILLELNEPALLSHIRIHNKSVLEWEISVGLRYKPETFVKVRPRCEAPRRDMTYPLNYTPCRYIRISCLRGNPIAIFFIQLIGVTVSGLEPDFQPVVNHLLPHIVSHKQDAHDMHLQLLRDMTCRLLVFLPQLEAELSSFSDAPDPTLRFLAMLAGPFYPILNVINERASAKSSCNISESEVSKTYQLSSALTVSSNFEPRRSRSTSSFVSSTSTSIMLRPDLVFMLLRKAYKDSDLGNVCRMASRLLQKLVEPVTPLEASTTTTEAMAGGELLKSEEPAFSNSLSVFDYSTLFGEEFHIPDDHWDISYLNVLDLGAVEEGILHVLYGCASQPNLCSKLASRTSEFWTCLPLVQALLPALRPLLSSPDNIDDSFSLWRQPTVQQALLEIVTTSSSSLYHPLLHACAGYLSSFSPSHAKAACVLIDLCCSVLAPWMGQVVAKVDLALELLEDLLGIIQAARNSITRARASLKYIVLAISGHVDDILGKYKEVKHRILFLVEMLEPFLDPAITSFKSTIAFGDSSFAYPEKQENNCLAALNVIRTAVQKPTVLPYLECEWRRGSVVPSVLLSILEPCMQLPPDIDLRICLAIKPLEPESSNGFSISPAPCLEAAFTDSNGLDEYDRKTDATDSTGNMDVHDDGLYFAPMELRSIALTHSFNDPSESSTVSNHGGVSSETKLEVEKMFSKQLCMDLDLDVGFTAEYFNLQADYFQLSNYQDSELRASAFRRLALDLHSQDDITVDGHDAAIDSLLLAAECYVNPFFMMSSRSVPKLIKQINNSEIRFPKDPENSKPRIFSGKFKSDLETIAFLEKKRDKLVLQVLLEAAELDRKYLEASDEQCSFYAGGFDDQVMRLSSLDIQSADAVTLVRQNQALLCIFLINRLQKKQHTMHEILIQSLVFLLHSATRLYCSPEQVIDIILQSAEHLNKILSSLYQQLKEGNLQLDAERIYGIQRRWILLRRLVVASCCADEGSDHFTINKNSGFRYRNLIPPSAWTERITTFCTSALPLVRFLGWMAVSHNAKQYIKDRLFLASNLAELTSLLSIFADELAFVDNLTNQRNNVEVEVSDAKHASPITKGCDFVRQSHENRSFQVLYPDLSTFFPDMKKQFEAFGETILEAVGLQLRSLSSSVVPDILCWLSELCSWPFNHMDPIMSPNSHSHLKGYVSKNAKAIILYVLESIITEHIEAMVHEIPRVVQVLVSLCRSSYCDVSFLDSVMHLLKPIISYSLHKVCNEERVLNDDVCCSFESLCFSELLSDIKLDENHERSTDKRYCIGLTIYILASVLPDLTSQRRREMLQYLFSWADFAECQPTSSFYDYLCAFQCVMESCKHLLIQTLKKHGALQPQPLNDRHHNSSLKTHSWFLSDMFCASSREASNNVEGNNVAPVSINQEVYNLSTEEVEEFCKELEILISKLNKTIELCWNLHHKIAKKLIMVSVECFIYSRCLSSVVRRVDNVQDSGSETSSTFKLVDQFLGHWKVGLVGVAGTILMLQEKNCWEVASVMLDCLLGVPFSLDNVIGSICSAIKTNACSAPKLAWRLQTDKWLSILLARDVHSFDENNAPLVDLFCIILGHPEPEQRYVALQLLRKLVSQDFSGKMDPTISGFCDNLFSPSFIRHVPDSFLSHLVSSTWDPVVVLATYDISLHIRTAAMVLILNYIPFAPRHLLQSFLAVTDNLHGLRSLLEPNCEGPFVRISVALIAGACLYCPSEDIYLIPENVWRNIETMGFSRTGSRLGYLEKKACQALCRLKAEGDDAKEVLKEVLSASYSKEFDPDFRCTRESILEILADLTSVDSYFDIFSDKVAQDSMELEEAEIELDFIQKENVGQGSLKDSKDRHQIVSLGVPANEGSRLQQIKEQIHALERSKVQEEIAARRQKKLLMRHVCQKHLEEVAVHEAELLQELDREREAEAEKEIERQLLLEHERAKTRELRHNLDMEKEKQTQRELQRELEQAEAGLRPSRRDFSSSTLSSRPRERYRERENGRSVNEGSTRSSSGSMHPETSMIGSMATVPTILSGSRSFSSQLPTILQSRDRPDECGSSYEENIDGSKDSGDTGSVGDADSVSVFDGQSGGFGSSQRHGSRGSKSRQLLERREWEGRREGKWERKH